MQCRAKGELLCNLISEVITHHILLVLFVGMQSLSPAHTHRITQGHEGQEVGFTGSHLRGCLHKDRSPWPSLRLFWLKWSSVIVRAFLHFTGKDPDAWKGWRQRRSGQQRIRWWEAPLTQRTWVWANSGDSERQRSLACHSPWGLKESDMIEQLNNDHLVPVPSYQ